MRLKPRARPARALPVGAERCISRPMRYNGWVALRVLQNGGEKRRLSGVGLIGPRIPAEPITTLAPPNSGAPKVRLSLSPRPRPEALVPE